MRRVVGLDVSLTGTGLAVFDINSETYDARTELIKTTGRKDATLWDRRVRLRTISDSIEQIVFEKSPDPQPLVVIEAPSYGSMNGHQHDRSGLWWLTIEMLLSLGAEVASVPPQTRAKYAAGKGNASKDVVLVSVVKAFPNLDITDNNIADAVALGAMGARYAGFPIDEDTITKAKLEAMSGAAWLT